jgi:hypothetical protein
MRNPLQKTALALILTLLLGGVVIPGITEQEIDTELKNDTSSFYDAGCTVIYGADEENVLGGNNEDFTNPDTRIWFFPSAAGKFGRALVGYEGFIWQGGMNDQGLFFDAMAVEEPFNVEQGDKPKYQGSLPAKALESCVDVDCVLDLFDNFHAYDTWTFQFLFGDTAGNSVIIEPHQIIRGGSFQVGTNFYQSITNENECRYCVRYWTARSMFENADSITVELMRDILSATQLEDDYPTQYSTIYDLKENLIYLYLFHDFEQVKVFDLEKELAAGYHVYEMVNLFPDNLDFSIFARTERGRQADIRDSYTFIDQDPATYNKYLGTYRGPDDLDMAFDYYSVDIEDGDLVLKLMPDKAWMKLEPIAQNDFFHLSYFYRFEITFPENENGEVNGFTFSNAEGDYEFERISVETPVEEEVKVETFWSTLWYKIWSFSGTNTFKFLAIILGLIMLQTILQYLKSLLA